MDARTITRAALDVLDEVGLDKLSMRAVATCLDVRVGGLYYYVADKSALLRAMADEICRDALADFDAEQADQPQPDALPVALCKCVRRALRARRDAARVLATGPLNGSIEALTLMERLIAVLEEGMPAPQANAAADALMSYLTGFVLQEQMPAFAEHPLDMTPDELAIHLPRVCRSIGADDDATFHTAINAIIRGFTTQPHKEMLLPIT